MGDTVTSRKYRILQEVRIVGDPSLFTIANRLCVTRDSITEDVRELVQQGLLRMKDDDYDHDWVYRLTAEGNAALGEST